MSVIKERLETIRLPANETLWRLARQEPIVTEILKNGGQITLFGTDPLATLENLILKDPANRGVHLTVIEREQAVIDQASNHITSKNLVVFLCGSCFETTPYTKQKAVLAKHLIHFCSAPRLVEAAMEILDDDGLFLASTPPLFDWKTRLELTMAGIKYEAESLGQGRKGGTLFIFRKPQKERAVQPARERLPLVSV